MWSLCFAGAERRGGGGYKSRSTKFWTIAPDIFSSFRSLHIKMCCKFTGARWQRISQLWALNNGICFVSFKAPRFLDCFVYPWLNVFFFFPSQWQLCFSLRLQVIGLGALQIRWKTENFYFKRNVFVASVGFRTADTSGLLDGVWNVLSDIRPEEASHNECQNPCSLQNVFNRHLFHIHRKGQLNEQFCPFSLIVVHCFCLLWYNVVWYGMLYLLTAVGVSSGGSGD
jgi:hypothetical protein